MSRKPSQPDENSILADAWDNVVGGMNWLQSVLLGEFADNRPISAIVADMLISFLPGVVIVTSARDAVAVVLRLANHPEKRDELMEWVLLSACLIVIALPIAMAASGAVVAGAGAVVGGIAGSELGAALRGVMLMLIKEASRLVEIVQFLQKFISGDILKFLRAIRFTRYEKALIQAMNKIIGSLLEIVRSLRSHLEYLRNIDRVKATINQLTEWERKFYKLQQDALQHMPKALAELDARLAKLVAETTPKEAHTIAAGVKADKTAAALPAKQRVRDTPGKIISKVDTKASTVSPIAKTKAVSKTAPKVKTLPKPPLKDKPDPVIPPDSGVNTKKLTAADTLVAADRARIAQISNEVLEAQKKGDAALALAKKNEAWDILRKYVPKTPADNWDEVIKRLDVSSPKDGAVFWSGDIDAARKFAESIGGVTLETTSGGRILDGWDEVNKGMAWAKYTGKPGPYARDLWVGVSKKYAEGVTGEVNTVQLASKLRDTYTVWHNAEKSIILDRLKTGEVSKLNMYSLDGPGKLTPLSDDEIEALMLIDGAAP